MARDFGQAIAARFDERGFAYFNREVFDAFYPGYGVSWPIAQGAIGMTFEMASARGLAYRRQDETTLTYLDGAVRHFTAAISTAATAARNREKMLRDFAGFRRSAGAGTVRSLYAADRPPIAGQTLRLVRTLVRTTAWSFDAPKSRLNSDSRTMPAGTFIAPLPQPAGTLLRNLLDPQAPMNADFLKAPGGAAQEAIARSDLRHHGLEPADALRC